MLQWELLVYYRFSQNARYVLTYLSKGTRILYCKLVAYMTLINKLLHVTGSLTALGPVCCYIALNSSSLAFLCILKVLKKHCPPSWHGFPPHYRYLGNELITQKQAPSSTYLFVFCSITSFTGMTTVSET